MARFVRYEVEPRKTTTLGEYFAVVGVREDGNTQQVHKYKYFGWADEVARVLNNSASREM